MRGNCRLCLRESSLCRSHVIPEFLYRPIYDEKHQALHVSSSAEHRTRPIQQGLREYLLCRPCEDLLNRWETVAAPVFRSAAQAAFSARPGQRVRVRADYLPIKLFQLSILWRSSVATGAAFADVSLGPHEDRIRERLVAQDPGEPHEYGCMLISVRGAHNLTEIMRFPSRRRYAGKVAYVYLLAGLVWQYIVSSSKPSSQHHDFLDAEGLVILVAGRTEADILRSFAKRIPPGNL